MNNQLFHGEYGECFNYILELIKRDFLATDAAIKEYVQLFKKLKDNARCFEEAHGIGNTAGKLLNDGYNMNSQILNDLYSINQLDKMLLSGGIQIWNDFEVALKELKKNVKLFGSFLDINVVQLLSSDVPANVIMASLDSLRKLIALFIQIHVDKAKHALESAFNALAIQVCTPIQRLHDDIKRRDKALLANHRPSEWMQINPKKFELEVWPPIYISEIMKRLSDANKLF